MSLSRLYSHKHFILTIAPTQSCNFGCLYCFEHWRKSSPITNNTINSIIKYLKALDGLESLDLTWYGGEPLLQIDKIVDISKQLHNLGLSITRNLLITNAYYLTKSTIIQLIDIGVTDIQITLDGKREIHDVRRPLLNGKGTFDKIIFNLDNYFFSEYRDAFEISIRVNVDKENSKDFIDIYQWLKERYKSDKLYIYPGVIVLDESNENVASCMSRNNVTDFYLELYRKYGITAEDLFPDDINMECMTRSPYMNMVIGPNGEIYKCYEDIGNIKAVVGNINKKNIWDNYDLISQYTTGIDHYNDPTCRACKYLPICNGGCPIRRYENKYAGKHNDCCTPFKERIQDYIDLYAEIIGRAPKAIEDKAK